MSKQCIRELDLGSLREFNSIELDDERYDEDIISDLCYNIMSLLNTRFTRTSSMRTTCDDFGTVIASNYLLAISYLLTDAKLRLAVKYNELCDDDELSEADQLIDGIAQELFAGLAQRGYIFR